MLSVVADAGPVTSPPPAGKSLRNASVPLPSLIVITLLFDGLVNTNAIVNQAGPGTSYAAGLCKAYTAGGFNDWYLPAEWELFQCYSSVLLINEVLGDINGFKYTEHYWSSNEGFSPATQAVRNFFGYYGVYGANKANLNSVRAVRKF
jgi:hypothetical protein